MYKKVSTDMDFVSREQEVLAFWKENHIFEKSCEHRAGGETFTFYDGPPTANGKPHIGHVLTRAIKDIIPRYRTMKGYHVLRKAGWDTHGLPVELEVEKKLGHQRQAADRSLRRGAVHRTSARRAFGNTRPNGKHMSDTRGLLGRHGASLCHI